MKQHILRNWLEDLFGSPAGASVSVDIAAVKTDTAAIATIDTEVGVIDGYHDVPTANVTTNAQVRDVLGNKTDTKVEGVGTTKSIIAYLKGIIQELAQRNVSKIARTTVSDTTYVDVVNISDKGVLTGLTQQCYAYTAESSGYMIITIDGTAIFTGPGTSFTGIGHGISISFNHRFDASLRVQHKISAASKGSIWTLVTYTID